MKRILVTGKNSYIGTSLKTWLEAQPDRYAVELIDVKDDSWKEQDFSKIDVLFHAAGVAHIKETIKNRDLYYTVNRDLAYEIAQKAKTQGVKQFIFLSSMSVYGVEKGLIRRNTPLKPNSNYGKSKLQAEALLAALADDSFAMAILRPPMVYGKGCKGNYTRLAKLAVMTPIFPDVNNKRSMLYIDNLSEFVRQLIDDASAGLFFPQNPEYVRTSEMVRLIAQAHGKKIRLTKLFNPLLKLLQINEVNKVFGSLVYDQTMSEPRLPLPVSDLAESIRKTEM
ncbi:MAG: NAD-dependent epimerase/dehydratase family protein [Eubacteriaceae bacterium]|nr:NAD-dependent epimerase/dehydratase family protein [Eubacteriaceae bacterium]